jgi:hypothetical protein
MIEWPELDALVEELRAQHEERWRGMEELRTQLEQLQTQLQLVVQQVELLQVRETLRLLNERLLGGMGWIEMIESGAGIEYTAALIWPSVADPRAPAGEPDKQGMYRIDVWLGLSPEAAQPRVRIAGAKRLEARLPTSDERFRAALLSVFRNPRFVEHDLGASTPEPEAVTEPSAAREAAATAPDAAAADALEPAPAEAAPEPSSAGSGEPIPMPPPPEPPAGSQP